MLSVRSTRSRRLPDRARLVALASAVVLAAACGGGASGTAGTPRAGATGSPAGGGTTRLVVGLGYTASVQFAQFYLAERAGYYREAGLEVEFQNRIDPELVTLVGQGALDMGMADGTSVIPAVSQGIPVRYAATVYGRFPNVVFAKASSGIRSPADLKGRRIGTPGRFGSGWIMLQAMLASAGLTTEDVEIVPYPDFGQLAGVRQGAVDAATGFVNNEPVQLELTGDAATVLRVDQVTPLPGPGLISSTRTLQAKREALRAFVAATLRAMEEVRRDPQKGLEAAIARVPELGADRTTQLRVLEATVESWQGPLTKAQRLGAIDRDAWARSVEFMRSLPDRPVPNPVTVDDLVTEELLPSR